MRDAKVFLAIVAGVVAFALVAAYASWGAVIALWVVAGAAGGIRARRWALRTHEARRLIREADRQHGAMCRGDYRTAFYGDIEPAGIDGKITWCTPAWVFDRPAAQPDYIGRLEKELAS